MSNVVVYLLLALFFSLSADASEVCGRVIKGSERAQLIPPVGKPLSRVTDEEQVYCGSMVLTNDEPVWIEMADLTHFKVSPGAFFEFSKKGNQQYRLYRGNILVSASPSIRALELSTPNAITVFQGGIMMVGYKAKDRITTLASFERKVEFKNKFYPEASLIVSAGEKSQLWIGKSNLLPSSSELIDPTSLPSALREFEIDPQELAELTRFVNQTILERSKSFVADLESWENIKSEKERQWEAQRSVASYSKKPVTSSIDTAEAKTALDTMKKRIYGEEKDWNIHDQVMRDPSSEPSTQKFNDVFYNRKQVDLKKKIKRVAKEIVNLEIEEE
jgi:hypothetical protein